MHLHRYFITYLFISHLKERPKRKIRPDFFWVARYKSGSAETSLFTSLWGKQNYQVLFVYRSALGQNLCQFLPYFDYNSPVFSRIILQDKLHSFNIQDDRSTRFNFLPQQIIKITTTQNVFIYREFTIGRDCSVKSICHYEASRVIIGFGQKRSKNSYFNSISKISSPTSHFWFSSAKLPVRAALGIVSICYIN